MTDGGGRKHGLIVQGPIVEVAQEVAPGLRNSASRVNDAPAVLPGVGTLLLIQNWAEPRASVLLFATSTFPPQAAQRGRSQRSARRSIGGEVNQADRHRKGGRGAPCPAAARGTLRHGQL